MGPKAGPDADTEVKSGVGSGASPGWDQQQVPLLIRNGFRSRSKGASNCRSRGVMRRSQEQDQKIWSLGKSRNSIRSSTENGHAGTTVDPGAGQGAETEPHVSLWKSP